MAKTSLDYPDNGYPINQELFSTQYHRGGKLFFDWDRLENFLRTHDWPVGNNVTSTKCQSWVSYMYMQCAIALVSDAQVEGKVSIAPKLGIAT